MDMSPASVLRGLAAQTGQAAGDIAGSVAQWTEQTADIEDANLARALDFEEQTASIFLGVTDVSTPPADPATTASIAVPLAPPGTTSAVAVRLLSGDIATIAAHTGIRASVIAVARNHADLAEHGHFTADDDIAALWRKAEKNTLTAAEHGLFRFLVAHEYVENRLMECGLPYRSPDPEAWVDGVLMFDPDHIGAHDVAPLALDGTLRQWPRLGLTPPSAPAEPNLAHLDAIVEAARAGLNR